MIIDPTDFLDRPYKVPNQEESRDFIAFLEEAERDIAEKHLLGPELWAQFQEGIETSGDPEQIWVDLRDGANYTVNNKTRRYAGWVDLIRPAIFSLWTPELTWKLTNVGYVENATPQQSKLMEDQYAFHVRHWNDFVTKVGYRLRNGYNCQGSFYGFMKANESQYEDWHFQSPCYKNRFDI